MNTSVDISGALRKLDMGRNGIRKAISRALNKTATTGRAQASKAIRDAGYNMKARDIKAAITIPSRATTSALQFELRGRSKPIPMIQYGARETRGGGVSVNVKNGRKVLSHAFIATMPSGHRGVFERVGKAHKRVPKNGRLVPSGLPIVEKFGPSIKAAFGSDAVQTSVKRAIVERFPVVLEQELRYESLRS